MGLTLTYVLSLFSLLAVSSGIFFLSKRLRLPYTVMLVGVGTFVLIPLSQVPVFSFIDDFTFTPELLFYIFLPILIFESAYNMDVRHVVENIRTISLLSVVSLLLSSVFIGAVLFIIFGLIGLQIPFIITLLFGALISATDPVAVLALFKDFGAPRRLSLIFEGESIFNDGTAVALFLIVLGVATEMSVGHSIDINSFLFGGFVFVEMIVGGILMGLVIGGTFTKIIGYARSNEFVSITLTIVLAHLTFILTEVVNTYVTIAGESVHFSSIIATTIASMVLGNYGRSKIPPYAHEFVEKFWGQFAFLTNSLVFILVGLMFSKLPFSAGEFVVPVLITIAVVAIGRAISIYPIVGLINWLKLEAPIPLSWQHLLAWGSLRGALAITMVLLIPPEFTVSGWQYAFSVPEFLLALTIGCIFATLFIKATTIGWIMEKLRISDFTDIEKLEHTEAEALVYLQVLLRLRQFKDKGYIDDHSYNRLSAEYEKRFAASKLDSKVYIKSDQTGKLADRVLRLYAIGIERLHLKELYGYNEIDEQVFKRIAGKLTIQQECADRGEMTIDASRFNDKKDVFELMVRGLKRVFYPQSLKVTPEMQYRYYRAQSIIARKVLKEFNELENLRINDVFDQAAFSRTKKLYETFHNNSTSKMNEVSRANQEIIPLLSDELAHQGIVKVEENVLGELREKQMITPKVYISLCDKLKLE